MKVERRLTKAMTWCFIIHGRLKCKKTKTRNKLKISRKTKHMRTAHAHLKRVHLFLDILIGKADLMKAKS